MTLDAGILLHSGDRPELEFETATFAFVPAIARSPNGFCFGFEFITPLPA